MINDKFYSDIIVMHTSHSCKVQSTFPVCVFVSFLKVYMREEMRNRKVWPKVQVSDWNVYETLTMAKKQTFLP